MKVISKKKKRGFVLTLDALIATIIVIMALSFSTAYFFETQEKIYYIYSAKATNDALAVLDYSETLQTLNQAQIMQEMGKLLPSSQAKFNIITVNTDLENRTNTIFEPYSEKNFVVSSKRFFVLKNSNDSVNGFGVVRCLTWKK